MWSTTKNGKKWNETNYVGRTEIKKMEQIIQDKGSNN